MSPSKGPAQIDYDDPKYRITPVQQAAASCTGALLTSVINIKRNRGKNRFKPQEKTEKGSLVKQNRTPQKPPQGLSIVIDFLINECGSNIEHTIYWMSYESIKSYMGCDHPSFRQSFIGGAISGSIAATITVPFDVVKTHQQIEFGSDFFSENDGASGKSLCYKGTSHRSGGVCLFLIQAFGKPAKRQRRSTAMVFRDIYSQYGVRGLYTGLTPRLIKVAPACAIMISSFEYGKVFFNRPKTKPEDKMVALYNIDQLLQTTSSAQNMYYE
ncbi:hypothetical protein YQE_03396, partial [Dendroctonus ponderosae]